MGARQKLNVSYFTGSIVVAAGVGGLTQSCTVFLVALAVLLALNLYFGEIRPVQRNPRGRETRSHHPR